MTLTELCQELKNWFELNIVSGKITITGEGVTVGDAPLSVYLQNEQYFRVTGSVFNDGVHQFTIDTLRPEKPFTGSIWCMAIPPEVVELAAEIEAWNTANAATLNSPYQSESFGGYSYAIKGGGGGNTSDSNAAYTWRDQFAARLRKWRKL